MSTATRSSRFLQRIVAATFAALSLSFAPPALYAAPEDAPATASAVTEFRHQEQPKAVEMVFCLDCSGSMSLAIDRAKQVIVALVREEAAKHPNVPLRLGLIRYGDGENRYSVMPLTENHKDFFQALAKTDVDQRARAEFFGTFVKMADEQAKWSGEPGVEKRIYVVGNESANQSLRRRQGYHDTVPVAARHGISVSAVYCASPYRPLIVQGPSGDAREFVRQEWESKFSWADAARLGGGRFLQVAYADEGAVALAWTPEGFVSLAERMEGDEYLARVIQEQQAAQRGTGRRTALEALMNRREAQAVDQLIALGAQPISLEAEVSSEIAVVP